MSACPHCGKEVGGFIHPTHASLTAAANPMPAVTIANADPNKTYWIPMNTVAAAAQSSQTWVWATNHTGAASPCNATWVKK